MKKFYGDKYDYFYKGHPASRKKPADTTLTVLPYRLPMEAIFFAYGSDINVIGGYQSTLYMSAPSTSKKFFFKTDKNGTNLYAPLDDMVRLGLFGDIAVFN